METDSRVEGGTAAIGIPCYIGDVAGAGVSAVGFGAATAATIAGGVVGAGLGALLAVAMVRRYADEVSDQRSEGGLVLWVSLRDDDAERRALHILRNAGGRDVHVHEFEREWTLKDRPLSDVQFDPLLNLRPVRRFEKQLAAMPAPSGSPGASFYRSRLCTASDSTDVIEVMVPREGIIRDHRHEEPLFVLSMEA